MKRTCVSPILLYAPKPPQKVLQNPDLEWTLPTGWIVGLICFACERVKKSLSPELPSQDLPEVAADWCETAGCHRRPVHTEALRVECLGEAGV